MMLYRTIKHRKCFVTAPFCSVSGPNRIFKSFYATGSSIAEHSKSSLANGRAFDNNVQSETNRLNKTRSRFWKETGIKEDHRTHQFEVQLDGKTMKSPLGFPIALPGTKKQLALLVAHEWSNLPDLNIKTNSLPLTSITARSIDLTEINREGEKDEQAIAKIGNLEDIKLNLINYLDTDTCLIFSGYHEYEGKLRKRQNELYLPLISEYESYFHEYAKKYIDSNISKDDVRIKFLDTDSQGLRGNKQTDLVRGIAFHWLSALSIFDLVAFEKAVLTSKSFLCGATLLRSNSSDSEVLKSLYQLGKNSPDTYYFKSIEDIIELGNLETIFQTEEWGEVEDTHDVDNMNWLRSLSSAALLCH